MMIYRLDGGSPIREATSPIHSSRAESCPSGKTGEGVTILPLYQRPNEVVPFPHQLSCQSNVPPSNQKSSSCCQSTFGAEGTEDSVRT